ncbi:hypothetical protein HY57_13295 [Dyella japonica A8]|uniref:Antitoxin Xre/MbcA/ParS-like toxin-binding domain-containing protein n=2 Tax=Dyella japonica TaxID=231455 RepID=A0A075K1T8_9GAMM|nr:hypothetical protein HY57_13295 [Dyella japonica A8]
MGIFDETVASLAAVESLRDKARMEAFDLLENEANTLANMVMQALGTRERAASWMCLRQRRLEGKSAYEVLAEGDVDRVWDLMTGAGNDSY